MSASRISIVLSLALAVPHLRADDWPQFLGPTRDGVSKETALNVDWAKKEPAVVWKAEVDEGVSSFCIVTALPAPSQRPVLGPKLYTMGNNHSKEAVQCLDGATGKSLWKQVYRCRNETRNFGGGTVSTPSYDAGLLYTLSHHGNLFCWDATTGEKKWEADLEEEYKGHRMQWGWAESPLVTGSLVVVQTGAADGALLALDKLTGKPVWKTGVDMPGYATGLPFEFANKPAVAFFNASGLVGSSLENGKELFRFGWKTEFDVNASMPLYKDGVFFLSSGYGRGCAAIDVSSGTPAQRWANPSMCLHFQNSVLVDGKVYGVSGDNRGNTTGELKCIDFATGALAWSEPMGKTYGQIIVVAGKLLIQADTGELVAVQPSAAKYQELARMQVLGGAKAWTVPAFSNGFIYCRQNEGSMVCLDLRP